MGIDNLGQLQVLEEQYRARKDLSRSTRAASDGNAWGLLGPRVTDHRGLFSEKRSRGEVSLRENSRVELEFSLWDGLAEWLMWLT